MRVLRAIDWRDRRVHIELALVAALALVITVFTWLRGAAETEVVSRLEAEARLDKASTDLAHRIENPLPWRTLQRSPWKLRDLPEMSAVLREFKIAERKSGVHLEDVDGKSVARTGREQFELVGTGKTQSLCAFLSQLEAQSKVLIPDSVQLLGVVGDDIRFILSVSSFSSGVSE